MTHQARVQSVVLCLPIVNIVQLSWYTQTHFAVEWYVGIVHACCFVRQLLNALTSIDGWVVSRQLIDQGELIVRAGIEAILDFMFI